MLKQTRGFTIVELLIVIVVIAILAAITVVSYMGIQNQAKNAQFLSSFDAYEKALRMIKAVDGSYPASPNGSVAVACMGDIRHYPATEHLAEGECYKYIGSSTILFGAVNPSVNTRLLQTVSTLPGTVYQEASFQLGGATYWYRGIFYNTLTYIPNVDAKLLYPLPDPNGNCGRGTKTTDSSGVTFCQIEFS